MVDKAGGKHESEKPLEGVGAPGDIEVTPQMEAIGAQRLKDLRGCAGSTYVASEVFRAML